ncbi:MAG: hypothetical protein ACREUP_05600, partial [Burkholderiales bacterium]
MKHANSLYSLVTATALAALLGAAPAPARAAQTDLSQTPLGTSATANALPNLMFILDDSGSMSSDHMPDEVGDATSCKFCDAANGSCLVAATACDRGHPPYYAAAFNTVYYNPNITYTPPVTSTGTSMGNANSISAKSNGYDPG